MIHYYNELHLGDCIYHINFMRKVSDKYKDKQQYFYIRDSYLAESRNHIVGYEGKIHLMELNSRPHNAINSWVGPEFNSYPSFPKPYNEIYLSMFDRISHEAGIENPIQNANEVIYDYPLLLNKCRLDSNFDILFINSTPQSGQFATDRNVFLSKIKEWQSSGLRVITTEKIDTIDCTRDHSLSLLEIGQLATTVKFIVGIDTAPMSTSLNKYSLNNCSKIYVMHNTNIFTYKGNIQYIRDLNGFKCLTLN